MSNFIQIRNASTHNLKNIDCDIPKNSLVVITGVSGSGKSSLAFDTIYAEGQRRYLESLSTYARMIISSINDETRVGEIRGLSPTIAIHQKTVSTNPRSTVGTITEIYDYLRLLFTTVGVQKCPNHPDVVLKKDTITDILGTFYNWSEGEKFHVLAPIHFAEGVEITFDAVARFVFDAGFVRYQVGDDVYSVGDSKSEDKKLPEGIKPYIVIDRLVYKIDTETKTRISDSLQTAYKRSQGELAIYNLQSKKLEKYHECASCPECGYSLQDLSISNFSFNSHYGACEHCHGLGVESIFLEENVTNPNLTLAEGAILPWSGHTYYQAILLAVSEKHKLPLNIPYGQLNTKQKKLVLYGTPGETYEIVSEGFGHEQKKTYRSKFEGVIPTLTRRHRETDPTDPFMKKIGQYITEEVCPECNGHRLKKEYLQVFIGPYNIGETAHLSVHDSRAFFDNFSFPKSQEKIVAPILKNIRERLEFLEGVGLGYITLARRANTLSGGESQRIRLATQIGTRLEGIIYVLDEPSIGLHPRDNDMLIKNIRRLVEIGNTVLVVEHDEDIMRASDYIIDIGPGAGVHGGKIIFTGTFEEICKPNTTVTGDFLSCRKNVTLDKEVRVPQRFIEITNARENNLRGIDVSIPVGVMTAVTGVSGSGKSSLVMDILANATLRYFGLMSDEPGKCDKISGLDQIDKTIIIDQSPIGKTPHSNIATYTGVFTYIREVFASSLEAQKRGFGPGRFSFNTRGGRCESCEGSGVKKIEMHFLPDVFIQCESCRGTRYNQETLEVKFKGKTIADILAMTCEDALTFFSAFPRISRILQVLVDVGLGYITLGQSAPTLSGGEAQRIKLAFDLSKRSTTKTLYILDEPTTGLHFSDVQKLLDILDKLVDKGNTVLLIEHNLDIIANSDYIIDIGPEGGTGGGNLMYAGTVEGIISVEESFTGQALKRYINKRS